MDIQDTIPWGNKPLMQKQLTSTTLLQLASEIAVSKHVVAQDGIPVKLGYCVVLVEVATMDDWEIGMEVEVTLTLLAEDALARLVLEGAMTLLVEDTDGSMLGDEGRGA